MATGRFHHSVPVARTEVWEEEPSSARLRWHRAYIPRYYSSTPLSYRVEMQEAGELDTEWRSVATDITTSDYTVRNISPRKDYRFRIRAQTENGEISEPTPPIQFYRTRVPLLKDSENALAEYKPVEYKAIFLKHPYYEQLTKYVPPTMPIHKPDMIIIDQETIELSWRPAIVAEAIRGTCNLTYTIEVRCPPSFEWRQLVTGLKICSHTVQKLHPRIDYIFRVRAWNEYGCSDAGLPVSLYRPAVYKIEGEDQEDEEFEREWERKYGTKVPPKLPIDTPRIVTQTSDSIWFTWLPARIPAYATQTNISYVVEIKEPPSTAWQRDAADLVDCQYVKEGLNPNNEYHIRVRAETEFGPSDATMPIIIRGKGSRSGSRRSSVDREERSLEDKIDLSYLDNVMAGVPPRMASSRPLASSVGPDRLTLTWSTCRTPSYVKASSVTYIIEKREPPGHVWTVLSKDITGHKFEITGLNPEQDYMFRVRARNEFGLSDPTLPTTLFRDRDDYVPPRIRSRSSSRDSISMLVSKVMRRSSSCDYNIQPMEDDRSSQERIPCQPQYITTTFDTQYGVLGKKGKIQLEVRGYPLPTVHWYKGEEKIEYGGQFNAFVTPTGGITLEIKTVVLDTVGQYKCYAENGSGAAVKMVTFELAEPPTVLETIKDISLLKGESATLSCRVDGFPSPTVKWMKDWRPLADCTRTKMVNIPPETYNLEIVQLIEEDDGLYACTVENMAGKVTVTGRLRVEIDSFPEPEINIRSTPIEEHYHVLEEIGRGRYGVVRRVIEISTGRIFAANFMSMRNKAQKHFFMSEYEVLRSISKMGGVLKLYDAFETERSLIFVTEMLSEPELLEKIITDGSWTEARVAAIIKKLLELLQELAQLNILHLDIKPSNLRMCGTDLDEIKLIGFGLSRILQPEEDITHNYGSVGYASPEQVTNESLKLNSDLWSVGVLSYLLLSGNGPFTGSSEVEILKYMADSSWTFEGRGFDKFSKEGLDFISKLLVKDPSKRMTLDECMSHPWLSTKSDTKINTEQLKQFYNAEKLQRQTEKVFTTVQLQSFAKIIHGAKALYQPAVDIESGEIIFPDSEQYGDYLDEDAWYEWQLQFLDDPDSQIFPIQDKKFTVRECRHAGAPKYSTPKQPERSDKDILDTGTGILFRDKIQTTTFLVGEDVTFKAKVVSETGEIPVVTWYRDEQLLSDDYRADASFNPETGLAKLKIIKSKDYDAAVYKCVARIKEGRVSCEARLLLGEVPSKPGRPLVTQTSGTETFLTWTGPVSDGNAYLLGYRVDYRKEGEKKWTQGPYVTEEYALLSGLEPNSSYIFRVSVHNSYGASPFSWSSLETKTLAKDAPKVSVAMDLQPLMQFSTFDKQQLILPAESRRPSLSAAAEEPKINESDPNEHFTFADTISKGSYGEYKLCTNKSTNQQCVAKIVPYKKDNHSNITAEFELLRTLSQANLVSVLDSYISADQFYVMYEYLSGINIVQYFCLQKKYKEETVARLVRQVLDALQYLEHFGIIHLNLQPTSMVMATRRRPHVKLRDFTLAHKVEDDKGVKVPLAGYPDFTSPEVLKGENVNFTADLWTLGAVTFTLMSGISPFGGKNLEETLSQILFDRYSTKEMYDNVTPESVKFVVKLLSRLPRNRPTVTKCLNSSWLNLNESMVNARNCRMFKSEKLRVFSEDYLAKRSDLDYSLALVDIEKLPKITTGPLVQPILSDKITHRLENLTKIKKQTINLSDSLESEVNNLPDQPLLEKLVDKIERDTEIKVKTEETVEGKQEIGIAEKADNQSSNVKKNLQTSEKSDQTDGAVLGQEGIKEKTEVEEVASEVKKAEINERKSKELSSEVKGEIIEGQKMQVEEATVKESVVTKQAKKMEASEEVDETDNVKTVEDTKKTKVDIQDKKEHTKEKKVTAIDTEKEKSIVQPEITEGLQEVNADSLQCKEAKTLASDDVKAEVNTENPEGEKIKEAVDIESKEVATSQTETKTEISNMCKTEIKEQVSETKNVNKGSVQNEIKEIVEVPDDTVQKTRETQESVNNSLEKAETVQKTVTEEKVETKNITTEKDIYNKVEEADVEIVEKPQDKGTEQLKDVKEQSMDTEDDIDKNEEVIKNNEIFDEAKNVENSRKLTEASEEVPVKTKDVKDQVEKEETAASKLVIAEKLDKDMETKEENVELFDKYMEIQSTEDTEPTSESKQIQGNKEQSQDENKDNKVFETQVKEQMNVDVTKSEIEQNSENSEVVEERIESIKLDKKELILSKTAESESENKVAVSESSEDTDVICKIAESTIEESKKTALEEVASDLKASEKSDQTDTQSQTEEEAGLAPVSEETITPEVKASKEQNESVEKSATQEDQSDLVKELSVKQQENITNQEKSKEEINSLEASGSVKDKNEETAKSETDIAAVYAEGAAAEKSGSDLESKQVDAEVKVDGYNQLETVPTGKLSSGESMCTSVTNESESVTETKQADSLQTLEIHNQIETITAEQTSTTEDMSTSVTKGTISESETKQNIELDENRTESVCTEQVSSDESMSLSLSKNAVTESETVEVVESQTESTCTEQFLSDKSKSNSVNKNEASESEMKQTDIVAAEAKDEQKKSVSAEQVTSVETVSSSVFEEAISSEIRSTCSSSSEAKEKQTDTILAKEASSVGGTFLSERNDVEFDSEIKQTDFVLTEAEEKVTETLSSKQSSAGESVSTAEIKETESEMKLENAGVTETVEKQVSEPKSTTSNDENLSTLSIKDETVSTTVVEEVDGVITKTVTVTQKHETLIGDGGIEKELGEVTTLKATTESLNKESSSLVESSDSSKVSVTQRQETLITGEESVENAESLSTVATTKKENIQESSSIVESSDAQITSKEQRQETLITGSTVSEIREDISMVGTSLVEESIETSAVSSRLETAKVTESRETIREFVTNDLEIEEMKKELLEDLEISSADCGKYLMGSHEDLSAIKEKIEKKPDEEEIEKETTNRYIDDALMFC